MHDGNPCRSNHSKPRGLGRLCVLALLGACAVPVAAAPQDVSEELGEMRRQLEDMRSENDKMRAEIDELRASDSEAWLTERRAEEIRELVADVLADSDTRTSGLQDGMTAGWSEHFFLASPDGRFKLQLEGQLQVRAQWNYRDDQPDQHRRGFEVTRARLTARGHVFNQNLTYLMRAGINRSERPPLDPMSGFMGTIALQDAWIGWQFNNEWSLRVGQFKLPFNREELVSSAYQLAVERSLVNESMNLGRSQGMQFTWASPTRKLMFAISEGATDDIGGFGNVQGMNLNPANTSALAEDVEWAITMRHEWLAAGEWRQFVDMTSPVGEEFAMLIGVAGHAQETEFTGAPTFGNRDETRSTWGTFDISIEYGGANLFGSFTTAYIDSPNFGQFTVNGSVLQGGYYLTQKTEVYARWEYGWWDEFNFAALNALTFGVNYYLDGQDAKWSTDIGFGTGIIDQPWDSDIAGYRTQDRGTEPQVVFRSMFQLLF